MITFLFGTYGSGKTTSVLQSIKKDIAAGIHTFLIVPEQEALQAERMTLDALPPSAGLDLEVLNFSRLYNRVCREYGGLCYRYITPPIRHLLMWQNLRELSPLLESYRELSAEDESFSSVMLSAISELKACGIRADDLEKAAEKMPKNAPLCGRVNDLALIFASFDRLVSQNYSDSADDLSRLADVLKKEKFFAGTHVYIDSFTSFTAMEHKIIERIFAQAEQVTVTVPLPTPEYRDISTLSIERSLRTLTQSADRHGGHKTVTQSNPQRAQDPAITYLFENLWRMETPASKESVASDRAIVREICDTPYAEAEAAASHILELLRTGERCRDIVILMRNPEQYRGIIEPALEKNDIPYFFSEKTDFCTLPPMKLLLSALRIKQFHWRKNDIISHIKTGMYAFSARDVDLFEEYMDTWNIQGNRFTDSDWSMNPDGFSEVISPRGREILNSANTVRRRLTEILERFFIRLESAETVADCCRAIYRYFVDIDLEKTLHRMALAESERGNRKKAKEYQSLYGLMLNTLADIANALPEEEVTTEELSYILHTVFRQTEIGTIPTSVDEVMIGSAATMRAAHPKYVFLLGLREGEFPAQTKDRGLFTDSERKTLSELGITLSSDADTRSSDELMYVQRAMAAPSAGLFVFTSTAQTDGKAGTPSLPFQRISALFPNCPPHRFDGSDLHYLAGSSKNAVSHLRLMKNTSERTTLAKLLEESLPHVTKYAFSEASEPQCRIQMATQAPLFERSVRFSASRFETYLECPFHYYCTYVLGLREKKNATFRTSDMGTFVHYILEQMVKFIAEQLQNGEQPNQELLLKKTEETVSSYIERVCPEELKSSARLRHLYVRLQRLSALMVQNLAEEFTHSEFRPVFFELKTNGQNGNPSPLEFVLADGCRVSFTGIIDRVDLLKKDGEVFVRIVDYKTGTKVFSLEDVKKGINIQMLLYLFTLCRDQDPEFFRKLGLSDGQPPTPAGIVYLSANLPIIEAEDYDSEDAILQKASDSLERSGLLLDEKDLLYAMNDTLSSKFLAGIKEKKDGQLVGKALINREGFESLYEQIETTVKNITEELRSGRADAAPLRHNGKDPCTYCKMKPICRRADK